MTVITRFETFPEDLSKMRISKEILMLGFLSERLLRILKRKMRQVMTFRSFDSLDYLCQSLTVLALLRVKNENFFNRVAEVFN